LTNNEDFLHRDLVFPFAIHQAVLLLQQISQSTTQPRGREPMAEPDVALLMTASGSLDIFFTRLLQMKLVLYLSYKAISNTM